MLQGVGGWVQQGCNSIGGWMSGGSLCVQGDDDVMATVVLQWFKVKRKQGKKTLNSVFW